ncbi:hypothetical protein BSI_39770 [Bacillus inaquosorum KCTC 13429]|uniref:Uncharacterized protein n=1 Tax=Bacillus inaquosorum KCTC 13429 TaxID=1236548 RepID=A0A9W5PBH5_9BACI|nr:hypothetical protein BSI_39770 [Bacillus inaquosorum KCTC 13429]
MISFDAFSTPDDGWKIVLTGKSSAVALDRTILYVPFVIKKLYVFNF